MAETSFKYCQPSDTGLGLENFNDSLDFHVDSISYIDAENISRVQRRNIMQRKYIERDRMRSLLEKLYRIVS